MTNVLHAAVATNITSVAVCALGSGIFGWDAKLAREVLVRATFAWECARLTRPCTVITVVFFDMSVPRRNGLFWHSCVNCPP